MSERKGWKKRFSGESLERFSPAGISRKNLEGNFSPEKFWAPLSRKFLETDPNPMGRSEIQESYNLSRNFLEWAEKR